MWTTLGFYEWCIDYKCILFDCNVFLSMLGNMPGFNISWLRSGHPMLNVQDLATEASHSLGLLLDQLRSPSVKSLSNSIVIVLTNRFVIFR